MTDLKLPDKYDHLHSEQRWRDHWESLGLYAWDSSASREHTYSVDTPPPTVSGSLHIGHVFSYTQTDFQVRFQRMMGKSIFYPMGWDDNGLPTERRVQNTFGITCNPALPYHPDWTPSRDSQKKRQDYEDVSRQNFIEACQILTQEDERAFEQMWRKLALSVDWSLQYETINDQCRTVSQRSFLDLVSKDRISHVESPTMWDVDFQTAVAQAELEDREKPGAYHTIEFSVESGGTFTIVTTRPELLPACIAVVAHPDDVRYQGLFGQYAITPLFHARVPILPAAHANPEKGTGILMVCTFGDAMDVEFWKQSGLPLKPVLGRNGRFLPVVFGEAPFESLLPSQAQKQYDDLVGLRVKEVQKRIVALLSEPGSSLIHEGAALVKEPEAITHAVKFYEKGDSPIEFITTRQWFIKILDQKEALLAQGAKIRWQPSFMKSRYDHWVSGLNQEWCISRQRFFGVPFPVWYPVLESGEIQYSAPIYAELSDLPVDPLSQAPKGYSESQRGVPGGFVGDPDVMDTWATSSLTPQIASGWGSDPERHQKVFPMDVRPQSHEIIRTWAFYTIAKAWMHEGTIPWKHVAISGWILDPDRKKMSKSKGNTVTPETLLDTYSSDAVRYWAAKAKLGVDTAFDENLFQIGKKLVTKIFNASKFVLMQIQDYPDLSIRDVVLPLDVAHLRTLEGVVVSATEAFKNNEYSVALELSEAAFWQFCDHYIELVKVRAYRDEDVSNRRSALASLELSLSLFLRLLAPFVPYMTEEIWSYRFAAVSPSVHGSSWPAASEFESLPELADAVGLMGIAIEVLSIIRGAKTQGQVSMKHPVSLVELKGSKLQLGALKAAESDLCLAGSVAEISYTESEDFSVVVTLGAAVDSK